MNLLDRIPWDEFVRQAKLIGRVVLGAIFAACLGAFIWVMSAWYTEKKQALYAPVQTKPIEAPVQESAQESADALAYRQAMERVHELEQQIAEFKQRRQREIADQQKRLANYERQIQELTMLLGDSDLQLRALQEASAKVPAMDVEQAAKVLGVKVRVKQPKEQP